ncbi:hypothetical protein BU17DRAFT_70956 [Hysterangium stoloniferum]|nr:hypothetical protein BU17DRAFT_70956 [Hysterangium stoloniferum]
MIAPTTPPAPSLPLPRIYEDVSGISNAEYIPLPHIYEDESGISNAEYIPPPPMPFRYIPLPPIYEDESGISEAEYIPPPPMPFRYIPLPPIYEDGSGISDAEYILPPPMPFRYIPLPPIGEDESVKCACCGANMEHANYHAYLPKLRLAGHIPLPPLPPDRDRCGAVVHETPVDVRCSAVVPHRDAIEVRAFRPSEGLPRAQATVPSRFISDRSQVTEPVFLTNGRRRTDLLTFSPTTSAKHVVWTQFVSHVFTLVHDHFCNGRIVTYSVSMKRETALQFIFNQADGYLTIVISFAHMILSSYEITLWQYSLGSSIHRAECALLEWRGRPERELIVVSDEHGNAKRECHDDV